MAGWLTKVLGRSSAPEPKWVEVADLRRRLGRGDTPTLIDVRGPDEFVGPLGHIDGAINIPLPNLPGQIADLVRAGAPVITVCLTDKRSATAAAELARAGLRNVAVLRGGMKAWRGDEGANP